MADSLAVIRIRGLVKVKFDIARTLEQLRLTKKNSCVVVPNTDDYTGMVKKVKDYVTWGPIDDATFKTLIDKKGAEYKGRITDRKNKIQYKKFVEIDGKKINRVFRLNSPQKGYGRKGIKTPFTSGGSLGDRGEKINDLLQRMM